MLMIRLMLGYANMQSESDERCTMGQREKIGYFVTRVDKMSENETCRDFRVWYGECGDPISLSKPRDSVRMPAS